MSFGLKFIVAFAAIICLVGSAAGMWKLLNFIERKFGLRFATVAAAFSAGLCLSYIAARYLP